MMLYWCSLFACVLQENSGIPEKDGAGLQLEILNKSKAFEGKPGSATSKKAQVGCGFIIAWSVIESVIWKISYLTLNLLGL